MRAVKLVYASALNPDALSYRRKRGLGESEEQMAILVQRVSGEVRGELFFPHVAGVGFSFNPFVWNRDIDPQAGMIRLVFGLGTRAVDRSDDDYTRVVALNAPLARPETSLDEVSEHAQRRVDVIDLARNRFDSRPFAELAPQLGDVPVELFATVRRDRPPVLTFDKLLAATAFVEDVRAMVRTLADAYRYPVDVEFTANFLPGGKFRLNLVQCRPLQVKEGGVAAPPPPDLPERAIVLASPGPVVGQSTSAPLDRVVFVDPDAYDRLGQSDRYEVARLVGRVTRLEPAGHRRIMLLGPGRWGTSTIALGVPTSFAEIQRVSAIVEIVKAGLKVVPDVSLGSHFFNDLVESNMLYLAVYPDRPGYRLQEELLRSERNRLAELLPEDGRMAEIVRVVDFPLRGDGRSLWLNADCVRQEAVSYLAAPPVAERPGFAE